MEDEEADGMEVEVNMWGGGEEKDKREEGRAHEERIAAIGLDPVTPVRTAFWAPRPLHCTTPPASASEES